MDSSSKRGSAPGRGRPVSQRPGTFKPGHQKFGGRKRSTPNALSVMDKSDLIEAMTAVRRVKRPNQNNRSIAVVTDAKNDASVASIEFIDENGEGTGVRLRKRQRRSEFCTLNLVGAASDGFSRDHDECDPAWPKWSKASFLLIGEGFGRRSAQPKR
jgi:hypothetical protein